MTTKPANEWRRFVKNAVASIRDVIGVNGRYYRYGIDDDLPNRTVEAVNDSGTARAAVMRKHQFLVGHGLPADIAGIKVNDNQTLEQLVDQLALMASYMEGFCIQVLFNNEGKHGEYRSIPVQTIRRRYDGGFLYDPSYGQEEFSLYRNGRNNAARVPEYGTTKTPQQRRHLVAEQIKKYGKQLGEFLYVYTPGVGPFYEQYAIPSYFSGIDDIKADASLSRLELRNISNGFNTGVIISTGPIDDTMADENNKTAYDRFRDDMENFVGEDAAAIMHIMSATDGAMAQVSRIDVDKLMDATENSTERLAKKICRHMGVPPVLIGIETAGKLGNSQELVNMMKLFDLSLSRERLKIEDAFKLLIPELADKFKIEPLRLFTDWPPEILALMTEGEKRDLYDLPAADIQEEDESVIKDKVINPENALNGAQVTAMVTVAQSVAAGQLSAEAGAKILSSSFPISFEDALEITNGSEKTTL